MRSALEKTLNSYSAELDRVLKDFELSINECDLYNEKACIELEKKIEVIKKENYPNEKRAELEGYYGDQMQAILEEMGIKKES